MQWNEIKNYNKTLTYYSNIEYGVNLPKIGEEVLCCTSSYYDNSKDIYFLGYLHEEESGVLIIYDTVLRAVYNTINGVKWARFERPETINNTGYAIACCYEDGGNFRDDIPVIINIGKDTSKIKEKINELIILGYKEVCVFKYILPCNFKYNWDYIKENQCNYINIIGG